MPDIDTSVPHIARMYDYWLGGKDNFAADRAAAQKAAGTDPRLLAGVRGNRAFLARSARFLAAGAGIRQFLDIGTGIPSADNTHEVAQAAIPAGSYLALSHPSHDFYGDLSAKMVSDLNSAMKEPLTFRGRDAVLRFFDGVTLTEPGLVRVPDWRPDREEDRANPAAVWGGVAKKP